MLSSRLNQAGCPAVDAAACSRSLQAAIRSLATVSYRRLSAQVDVRI